MTVQDQENKSGEQQQEQGKNASVPPALDDASRSAWAIAKIRRRAILIALGMALFLLVIGFGDGLAGFLPHTTAPFANGRTQSAGALRVTLQFSPNPPKASGDPATLVQMVVQGSDGQAIDGARVQVSLVMVTMDMGVNETTAQGLGQGRYQARVAFLMPGAWQVTVSVTPAGGTSASTTFDVDVAA
jgi:hypothetical protein